MGSSSKGDCRDIDQADLAVARDVFVGLANSDQAADFGQEGWVLCAHLSGFRLLLHIGSEPVGLSSGEMGWCCQPEGHCIRYKIFVEM